ncbi:hypothetical protein K439DRAFT_1360199, partial [Ramaria rubella]
AHSMAKGTDWVLQFRRLARPSQGMPHRYIRRLYNAVAVPRMLYVANVFCRLIHRVEGKQFGFACKLTKIQWTATLSITGAMHSMATDQPDAHADLKPTMFLVNQVCQRAAVCLATHPPDHPLAPHM